LKDDIIIYKRK